MSVNLEELALQSIQQYATIGTRLNGVEATLQHIRSDNAQMLRDFNDALRVITDIQRQLLTNTSDHEILHERIDDVKAELDSVQEGINTIKTTCATNGHYRSQIKHLEELITQLEFAAKVFGYKLFGAPVWAFLIFMIVSGFIVDVIQHRDIISIIIGLFH